MSTTSDATAPGGAPPTTAALLPKLVSDDAPAALDFYVRALGAEVVERHDGDGGRVHQSVVAVGAVRFSVKSADEVDRSPVSWGGTPVVLQLHVDDVDTWAARFEAAGGEVVFPVGDREYGRRDGRFADPAGHVWQLSGPLRAGVTEDGG